MLPRRALLLLPLLALACAPRLAAPPEERGGVTLALQIEPEILLGAPVLLHVETTNRTGTPLHLDPVHYDPYARTVEVFLADAREASVHALVHEVDYGMPVVRGPGLEMPDGGALRQTMSLSSTFELDEPGEYIVVVRTGAETGDTLRAEARFTVVRPPGALGDAAGLLLKAQQLVWEGSRESTAFWERHGPYRALADSLWRAHPDAYLAEVALSTSATLHLAQSFAFRRAGRAAVADSLWELGADRAHTFLRRYRDSIFAHRIVELLRADPEGGGPAFERRGSVHELCEGRAFQLYNPRETPLTWRYRSGDGLQEGEAVVPPDDFALLILPEPVRRLDFYDGDVLQAIVPTLRSTCLVWYAEVVGPRGGGEARVVPMPPLR